MHFIKTAHKWLSLVIGIQLALWLASGLVFNLLDPREVSGRNLAASQQTQTLAAGEEVLDHQQIAALYGSAAIGEITLIHRFGRNLYRVIADGEVELRDAADGEPFAIDRELARQIASADYTGDDARISAVEKIEAPTVEVRKHKGPVWQVSIADEVDTTLYISAGDGRVLERRNDTWRLFDFFWMLHIMDYAGRENFNNPVIIVVAFAALWLVISGCMLLFSSFSRQDFNLLAYFRRGRSSRVPMRLYNSAATLIEEVQLKAGGNLFDGLAGAGFSLPSNCGGGGSCGLCQVRLDPAAPLNANEKSVIPAARLADGYRLACQQRVAEAAALVLDDAALHAGRFAAEVIHTRCLTPFIKEIHLRPLDKENFEFVAGSFVQVEIPVHRLHLKDIALDPAHRADWEPWYGTAGASHSEPCLRSYSMANSPGESMANSPGEQYSPLVLNVRIQPPPQTPQNRVLPAGRGSSYMFNLGKGDRVNLAGPYGNFYVKESRREMVFIGGGAGMAPLRSMIVDQLSRGTERRISFWYGARSLREVFYRELFNQLATEHGNFSWHLGLSEPLPEDGWRGERGFISDLVLKNYLAGHRDLGSCEFYLCGPPAMLQTTIAMLQALGVDERMIAYDDFGS